MERGWRSRLKIRLLSLATSLFVRALIASLRKRHVDVENLTATPQYVLAFWHAHLAPMLGCRFRHPICVMVSQSKDGDLSAATLNRFGVETVRGSSTRGGGAALREVIRLARDGRNVVFTPDGPTGPPRVAKLGVVSTAQATGLPIVPVAFAAEKKKHLRSWDRMVIPMPFSRAVYVYGRAIEAPRGGSVDELLARVETAMNALAERAEACFAPKPEKEER